MDTKDKLIEKLKELIKQLLPYFNGFGKEAIDVYNLRTEIASLEQQLKSEQCDAIIETIKEAWTSEKVIKNDVCSRCGKSIDEYREKCYNCGEPTGY